MQPKKKASRQRSSSSTDDRVVVGRLGRPHGVRGELVLRTQEPSYFVAGARFVTETGRPLTVRSVRTHHQRLLVAFEGFPDRTAVEELRETDLTIGTDELAPLPPGEYRPGELIGLEARHADGTRLGAVTAVHAGDLQDRLVIATPGGDVEVPFVEELVPHVDLDAGQIIVDPPDGLF